MLNRIAIALAGLALAACQMSGDNARVADYVPDADLKSDLAQAGALRVFFGHQSVGANVVEGLGELRSMAGDTALHVIDASGEAPPHAFFAQAKLGKNGDPFGKLAAFRHTVDSVLPGRLDAALLKICFVDLGRGTGNDPDSLFTAYRRTMLDLETANPGLVLIPVTSPLTVPDYKARGRLDMVKGALGRWLGRPDDNSRRAEFNGRLREAFRDRSIFDLAAIESTRPDGTRVRYGKGGAVEALAEEYSLDGAHLNALGRKVAARELLRVLARIGKAKAAAN
jgi:hypothetical protein